MKIIRAVKPNAGIQLAYQRDMEKLIDDVNRSVVYWVRKEYRKREPQIAMDSAASAMGKVLARLFKYWLDKWTGRANSIAERFIKSNKKKTQSSYVEAFKAAGFTVKPNPSRILNDTVEALIAENVALITSIPERYFSEITELVQRCVAQCRNIFLFLYLCKKSAYCIPEKLYTGKRKGLRRKRRALCKNGMTLRTPRHSKKPRERFSG